MWIGTITIDKVENVRVEAEDKETCLRDMAHYMWQYMWQYIEEDYKEFVFEVKEK